MTRILNSPVEVILQREVLSNQHCLAIFLDHVEVVRGVHSSLEQDADVVVSEKYEARFTCNERVDCIFEEFGNEIC